jgi:lysophospholipase L1-like esterase
MIRARRAGDRRGRVRWRAAIGGLLLAAAIAPTVQAAPGDYVVALGDSFSAGEGAPRFDPGTDTRDNTCHRSSKAWPALLAKRRKARFRSFACSGALVVDVLTGRPGRTEPERQTAQVARLLGEESVDLVTLTIGGNDAGFADVLIRCAFPFLHCDRYHATGGRNDLSADIRALGPRLRRAYTVVKRGAPGADLLVLGYPRLFPASPVDPTCAPSSIDADEIRFLNARGAQLNRIVRSAARAKGATFVKVLDAFDGHEVRCGADPRLMVNKASIDILGRRYRHFFHPTALGYRRLAQLAAPAWP